MDVSLGGDAGSDSAQVVWGKGSGRCWGVGVGVWGGVGDVSRIGVVVFVECIGRGCPLQGWVQGQ